MTASKLLPARPSLESLRKQAKKFARAHLPNVDLPLTQRNAQLVIAREYGYAGWQDLTAEVTKRVGKGLEWAVAQAERAIHDNDVERLKDPGCESTCRSAYSGSPSDAERILRSQHL